MQKIKLNDDVYTDFLVYTKSEWEKEQYKDISINDKSIRCNLINGEKGTVCIFENKHF